MTHSAEQASVWVVIDDAQANLRERCERLLASSAWNKAHTATHKGLLKRLQMIQDAGLNPMSVVAHRTLKRLGRIPRSHEGHQEDAIAAVRRCGAQDVVSFVPSPAPETSTDHHLLLRGGGGSQIQTSV